MINILMKYVDIFGLMHNTTTIEPLLDSQLELIRTSCSQFMLESESNPLLKNITRIQNFVKLKARQRKQLDAFSDAFNSALSEAPNLRQRAVYVHGTSTKLFEGENTYFIFPINGFKYVFNPNVHDSSLLESIHTTLNDSELFTDLLQHQYMDVNLSEGIMSGAEILLHGTPYCYAVNTIAYPQYSELLKAIENE